MTDPNRDFLKRHLAEVPLFRALLRSVECRLIAELGPLRNPVLDLGCGDGCFASQFEEGEEWVGLDHSHSAIREARGRGQNRKLVVGDSGSLPFPDNSLETVLANSVLEHVLELDRSLAEIHRVLRPGGDLLVTAPSGHFAEMLFFSSILHRIGLHKLGKAYGSWFNRHSLHHHTDSIPVWRDRLGELGFEILAAKPYFSRRAHWVFDWTHYLSLPRWISHRATGKWVLFPNLPTQRLLHGWLSRFGRESEPNPGAYLFIQARKSQTTDLKRTAAETSCSGGLKVIDSPNDVDRNGP